jgi:6-pyruvoyltetrahydropterin/6-carboxytetrahydropterin synthase
MYETGTASQVRSFHIMPGMPPPEGERHSHDYRLELVVSREDLDDKGMVVDLDLLDGALGSLTAEIDEADLDAVVGPQTAAAAVTVEVFARWVHERIATALGPVGGATLSVRVWETATAFGGYTATLDGAPGGSGASGA